ncbi:MAG: glycosyltransferase family 2 protein [Chitinophagaceae bacterium]|nr:MAG: glycosyltransferase family 2 protein [Chitinophagaceae bacterium]
MKKITAIIPTFNEEANIEMALQSVMWADEVLVVDSFSTDKTLEIARSFGATILQRKFDTHAKQKNWAIEQVQHEWIFILDADEKVTPALKQEIKSILAQQNLPFAAYQIRRDNYFMGQLVRYSGWQGDKVIRLFNKQNCRYEDKNVHEEIIANGKTGELKNRIEHYTYRGLAQYLQKFDQYTWLGAKDRFPNHKPVTLFHLAGKPAFRFFKHYILQLGFLDGKVGFVISYMSAVSVFMRNLKLWRLQQGEKDKV